ncbi:hypothetical protein [Bacteroides sp.]|uniref:XkdQ/YqbQ family protein n=1 Tax=Bacteroides sp. TaxID=29523 RepID=UPI0026374D60|nr:hypothetical protein [Bacteroides sp.]MDD3039757.1 hypothetical protein [Bacteroides sp.]
MLTIEYQDYDQIAKDESFYITSLVHKLTLSTAIENQPSKVRLTVIADKNVKFHNGGRIKILDGDKGLFLGYIFEMNADEHDEIKLTCYDQLRYLKNNDVYISRGDTLATLFTALCKRFELKHLVSDTPKTELPITIHDNKSLYDIISWGIGITIRNEMKRYIVWDDFGVLELFEAERYMTDWAFGDNNLVFSFDFSKSIDKDTYNQIKYSQENKDLQVRQNRIIFNSNTKKRWGTLQFFKTIDEAATPEQIVIEMYAKLKLCNHETRKISFKAIGNWDIRAGKGIWVMLKNALEDTYIQRGIVSHCTHRLDNDMHTMDLEVEVPRDEDYEKLDDIGAFLTTDTTK